jgi:molecular chaperone DnaK (HSP70)
MAISKTLSTNLQLAELLVLKDEYIETLKHEIKDKKALTREMHKSTYQLKDKILEKMKEDYHANKKHTSFYDALSYVEIKLAELLYTYEKEIEWESK